MYILPESMEPETLVQLLSTDYKFAVSFSILVIVLLYRPMEYLKEKYCEKEFKYNCSLHNNDGFNYFSWNISIMECCSFNI